MPHFPDDPAIFAVLEAISTDEFLSGEFVLKGGNALKLAYYGIRASVDLDFTAVEPRPNQTGRESRAILDKFCMRLDSALSKVAGRHGFVRMNVQRSILRPPNVDPRHFPALEINVGYTKLTNRDGPFSDIVKLEITLNDVVCEDEYIEVKSVEVHVSSLDDIIAEKLRALLQQIPRNRNRPRDVFDIWFYTTRVRTLDIRFISSFLQAKCNGRDGLGVVTKQMFLNPELRTRAAVGYDEIETTLPERSEFPTFDMAFDQVLAFVDILNLPDQ